MLDCCTLSPSSGHVSGPELVESRAALHDVTRQLALLVSTTECCGRGRLGSIIDLTLHEYELVGLEFYGQYYCRRRIVRCLRGVALALLLHPLTTSPTARVALLHQTSKKMHAAASPRQQPYLT